MTGYRELLEKEVIEAWRTRRVWVVCIALLLLAVAAVALTRYLPDLLAAFGGSDLGVGLGDVGVPDVVDDLLTLLIQFGAIAAILLAAPMVAGEKTAGSAAFVLSKPVSRFAFLVAKAMALAMVLAAAVALAIAGAWAWTGVLFERVSITQWLQMAVVVWLSAMVYGSITLLGSVLASSTLGAAAFGFGGFALLTLLSAITTLATWLPPGLKAVAEATALAEISDDLDVTRTLVASIGIAVTCLLAAWLAFRRQDL